MRALWEYLRAAALDIEVLGTSAHRVPFSRSVDAGGQSCAVRLTPRGGWPQTSLSMKERVKERFVRMSHQVQQLAADDLVLTKQRGGRRSFVAVVSIIALSLACCTWWCLVRYCGNEPKQRPPESYPEYYMFT